LPLKQRQFGCDSYKGNSHTPIKKQHIMSEYNILTVFKGEGFTDNSNTFDNPAGGGEYWDGRVYMITNASTALSGTNASASLTLTVKSGDTINWLDTPINQGMRHSGPEKDIDILVYGMQKGSNWDDALTPLVGDTKNGSRAYIPSNFDNPNAAPTFQSVTFPNNFATTTVKTVTQQTRVTYYLKVVKLDLTDTDNIKVLGYYKIDPTIIINP
jgi:hypothetical protein